MKYSIPLVVPFLIFLIPLVNGNMIDTVEYSDGPRVVNDEYFARGRCFYEFDILYAPAEVLVNITFDREISEFDVNDYIFLQGRYKPVLLRYRTAFIQFAKHGDFGVWERVDSAPGVFYYSQSRFHYNPGQQVPIDFNLKWDLSQGATPPNGMCETNVGFVVTTTTTGPPPDEAEAVEIAVQALFDDVEALDPAYRRIFPTWP